MKRQHSQIERGGGATTQGERLQKTAKRLNKTRPENDVFRFITHVDRLPELKAEDMPPLPPIKEEWARKVFTHTGSNDSKYDPSKRGHNYERLEFLGDACLEFLVTSMVDSRFPDLLTGQMAQIREALVRNSNLARFSDAYGFKHRLNITGKNQANFVKIGADVFEAYIGAIIKSDPHDGLSTVYKWLTVLFSEQLLDPKFNESVIPQDVTQNWKAELQKRIGGRSDDGRDVKFDYRLVWQGGKNNQEMHVELYLYGWGHDGMLIGRGQGMGKTQAGMRAAQDAFENHATLMADMGARKKAYDEVRRQAKKEAEAKAAAEQAESTAATKIAAED